MILKIKAEPFSSRQIKAESTQFDKIIKNSTYCVQFLELKSILADKNIVVIEKDVISIFAKKFSKLTSVNFS